MRYFFRLAVCTALLSGSLLGEPAVKLADLRWLAGCWSGPVKSGTFEECWSPPLGDSMQGSARIVTATGTTVFREFILLEESAGSIVMTVQHFGSRMASESKPVSFTLKRHANGEAVFENPLHDSPQRIIYRKQADGGIVARVEKLDGTDASEFPMRPR